MGDPGDTARVRVALAVALLGAVGAGVRPHAGLLPAAALLTPASCLHFTSTKYYKESRQFSAIGKSYKNFVIHGNFLHEVF